MELQNEEELLCLRAGLQKQCWVEQRKGGCLQAIVLTLQLECYTTLLYSYKACNFYPDDLSPSYISFSAKPTDFDFLKVIGKGSFGKVSFYSSVLWWCEDALWFLVHSGWRLGQRYQKWCRSRVAHKVFCWIPIAAALWPCHFFPGVAVGCLSHLLGLTKGRVSLSR